MATWQSIEDRTRLIASRARPGRNKAKSDLGPALFGPQRRFVADAAKHKTAVCSRRAGKTVGCAAELLGTALDRPGSVSLYITLSRLNAKRIVWRTLKDLNREHGLGGSANESELCIAFPNGSLIYLAGVKDKGEIEKFRGLPLAKVVIDEAQSLPAYIEELVDDVIAPALMDFDGTISLIGTPGPVPVGYFYDCTQSAGWAHHSWTVFDNEWIERKSKKSPAQHLEAELQRRGLTQADPSIQREWFGQWRFDPNSLVFRYDSSRNHFDALPPMPKPWQHVIGVDLGFDDADAIAVLAFNEGSPNAYLVEEWAGTKQTITQLAARLEEMQKRLQPLSIVVDTGGLGKKIADEITKRTPVALKAAEKTRKFEYIELVNDALRSGRLHARRDGLFAHDAMLVEWDRSNPERPKISDRFHSDISDALLYTYRESLHWLHTPPAQPKPQPGTPEHADEVERELEAEAIRELEQSQDADADAWFWGR